MNLAVNYSQAAADLLKQGQVAFDYFKCPAWPDLVATAGSAHPTYVHFPLVAGQGGGDAVNSETRRAPDWGAIEALLEQTGTPLVNLHLAPTRRDHPDIPVETDDSAHVEYLTECLIGDVRAVVARFGAERVIVESVYDDGGVYLRPSYLPAVVRRVVDETGCGLLLDISHARLAAWRLGMDPWAYVEALPVERLRELHVTGIQRFDETRVEQLRRADVDAGKIERMAGRLLDHLPLTADDWPFVEKALDCIRRGAWGRPWAMAFEYGGVGPVWGTLTQADMLQEQVPRLYALAKA